jgi:transcriptional regulator NrdR family protein
VTLRETGGKPPCPRCGSDHSKVIDSGMGKTPAYARIRECLNQSCLHRWITLEQNFRSVRRKINSHI